MPAGDHQHPGGQTQQRGLPGGDCPQRPVGRRGFRGHQPAERLQGQGGRAGGPRRAVDPAGPAVAHPVAVLIAGGPHRRGVVRAQKEARQQGAIDRETTAVLQHPRPRQLLEQETLEQGQAPRAVAHGAGGLIKILRVAGQRAPGGLDPLRVGLAVGEGQLLSRDLAQRAIGPDQAARGPPGGGGDHPRPAQALRQPGDRPGVPGELLAGGIVLQPLVMGDRGRGADREQRREALEIQHLELDVARPIHRHNDRFRDTGNHPASGLTQR